MRVEDALVIAVEQAAPADAGFMASLVERVENGVALTGKQRRAAHRMLARYADALRQAGFSYDDIEAPNDDVGPAADGLPAATSEVAISVEGNRIIVRSPYKYKDVCRSVPAARWNNNKRAWTYPESPTSAVNVESAFAAVPRRKDDAFEALLAEAADKVAAQVHKSATDLPPIPVSKTDAWMHQRQAFWFGKDLPALMLAMDMGTGKSKVTVDLVVNNGAEKTLIVCPLSVLGVWGREFRVHAGRPVHVEVLNVGSVADRTALADDVVNECRCGRQHVVAINYEAAWREPFAPWSLTQSWDYVVFDESHRIKAATGTISKYCAKLAKRSERKVGLTGTPMSQSPLDVFGQYRALDPDIFGVSYTSFQRRYAIMGGYGGYEVIAYQNVEELNQKFFSIAYRVDADVLDLPESVDVHRACTLSSSAAKTYRALERELWTEIEGGELSAPNVLVKMLRLQQITGGSVNDDNGKAVKVDESKKRLLRDVLEDVPRERGVVVFCRFQHDLDVVSEVAAESGLKYGELSGRRNDLTTDSTMPRDIEIMAVQVQAGGVGVDLTRASVGIYYSLGFSLSDYLQTRRRLLRPGQEREVIFMHLVAAGTIDETVYEALANRQAVVDYVLESSTTVLRGTDGSPVAFREEPE